MVAEWSTGDHTPQDPPRGRGRRGEPAREAGITGAPKPGPPRDVLRSGEGRDGTEERMIEWKGWRGEEERRTELHIRNHSEKRHNRNHRRETETDRNRERGRNHRMENRIEIAGWKVEEDGEGGRERRSRQKETKGQRKNCNYEAICASR